MSEIVVKDLTKIEEEHEEEQQEEQQQLAASISECRRRKT